MVWRTIVVFAAAVAAISAEDALTFPEVAREYSSSRIVSGWEAQPGQIPYQLSLRMVSAIGGVSSCGATLIHERWGLTAAHCTASRISFVIRAGAVSLTSPVYVIETTQFYNHPLYNNDLPAVVQPHDIGLLEWDTDITFNALVQPIRLQRSAAKTRDVDNQRLIASGWGRTWTNGASPENLNWVYLSGVTNEQCSNAFGGSSIIVNSTICARGYNETTQSTCQGDSGGPLVGIDDDGKLSQVGVTSFVSAWGCHAGFPAGFIRPGYYHGWFTNVTSINFDWEFDANSTETPGNGTTTELPPSTNATVTETPELPDNVTTTELPSTTSGPGNETITETPELPDNVTTTSGPGNETSTETPELPDNVTTTELPSTTSGPGNETITETPELPDNVTTTSGPGNETNTETPELPDNVTTTELPSTTSGPGNETITETPELPTTTSAPGNGTTELPGTTVNPEEEEDCEEGLEYFVGPVNIVDY